jgi:hypothetical protein
MGSSALSAEFIMSIPKGFKDPVQSSWMNDQAGRTVLREEAALDAVVRSYIS